MVYERIIKVEIPEKVSSFGCYTQELYKSGDGLEKVVLVGLEPGVTINPHLHEYGGSCVIKTDQLTVAVEGGPTINFDEYQGGPAEEFVLFPESELVLLVWDAYGRINPISARSHGIKRIVQNNPVSIVNQSSQRQWFLVRQIGVGDFKLYQEGITMLREYLDSQNNTDSNK